MGKNSYSYHNPSSNPETTDRGCCSIPCLKFSVSLFNVLFFLSGLILGGLGLWTNLEKHAALLWLSSGIYDLVGYILIMAGAIVILTTFLGCCGLIKTSRSLVLTYSIVLGLIFCIEAGAGVLAYLYRQQVNLELADNLSQKFNVEYGLDNSTTQAVDQLQISLECCGVHNFMDWQNSVWFELAERKNNRVPDSCCISPGRYCGVRDHPSNIRYTGCVEQVDKIANSAFISKVSLGVSLAFGPSPKLKSSNLDASFVDTPTTELSLKGFFTLKRIHSKRSGCHSTRS
eukprot:maker-scaffold401_size182380-snap-gene-0.12 protein:Tk02141 transcript:maker-scaffold401_size182380-snap-gene-0.12-mRNA-1 annotation:"cd151 antigen"